MPAKNWARAFFAFGQPVVSRATVIAESPPETFPSPGVDFADLNLDRPSDAFEALRRAVASSPTMHGEAPEFHRA
ncbi:MAG: hypothetical protein ACREEB_18995 [Caulobacteraceae bacterium]